MAASDALEAVALGAGHIEDATALVDEAGWNQTPADWRMMLAEGRGRGFVDGAGRLVASAVTLPYGEAFGWISMVLVTRAWRRKGLATRLLEASIADLEAEGRIPVLDATPDGEPVYRRLGFAGTFTFRRWQCPDPHPMSGDGAAVRPLEPADLAGILALDREAFGGDRAAILRDIATREGGAGWVLGEGGGFLLAREGLRARQLGPLVADGEGEAAALLAAALAGTDGPVFLDVPDRHEKLIRRLEAAGFTPQRPFLRMLKGRDTPFGDIGRMHVLAGPELG